MVIFTIMKLYINPLGMVLKSKRFEYYILCGYLLLP